MQIEKNENNIIEINKLVKRRPEKEKIIKQVDFVLGEGAQIIFDN
jgi:hypothetical protein